MWFNILLYSILFYSDGCRISIRICENFGETVLRYNGTALYIAPGRNERAFIQAQIKENIKAPRHWSLCGEFTGHRWIHKGPVRRKIFPFDDVIMLGKLFITNMNIEISIPNDRFRAIAVGKFSRVNGNFNTRLKVIWLRDNGYFAMLMVSFALMVNLTGCGHSYWNINRKSESLNHWITCSATL